MKRSRPNVPGRLPWPSDRIVAVDLARFLALIGMFSEHLITGHAPAWLLVAVTGFPSTAFAVLSGISAVISMRRYTADGRPLAACVSVAIRGFIVMVIGLVLGAVPLFLVMVLSYFGFALILAAAVLWMPTWALGTVAGIICATSPHVILWARAVSGDHGPVGAPEWSSPAAFFTSILFTGFYPAYTWLGYILIGACAGRILTRTSQQHRASIGILAVGLVTAAAGAVSDVLSRPAVLAVLQADGLPALKARVMLTEQGDGTPLTSGVLAVVNAAPHSGTTADMLRTAGVALGVLALLLLATRKTSRQGAALGVGPGRLDGAHRRAGRRHRRRRRPGGVGCRSGRTGMSATTRVIRCPNCGRKIRLPSAESGHPRCGNCRGRGSGSAAGGRVRDRERVGLPPGDSAMRPRRHARAGVSSAVIPLGGSEAS